MLVADILNPYSVAVLHGAEAACQKHGYTLMLCNTGAQCDAAARAGAGGLSGGAAGPPCGRL
ncbi:conserved hypothetical protein [Ricinus communis]|uniref:Uncharacterized protein n=1 Tax=Ricinus communis TaxID=3988 RepID=B9TKI9_RICCO|nr:conserved hypothetical protein [Ricinus communis]